METVVLRVKKDKVDVLKSWMEELRRREGEVLETMRNEGSRHEAAYLLENAEGPVLVWVQEVADPERAHRVFRESGAPIDSEHREVMGEVISGRLRTEELLNLSVLQ